ncbi:hypothetical protein LOZ55_004700 [Ophidiomyces ophidiicola]|nr:hypothetical protein LOZ55_004700 [Ophidiomyces ophidiicola]
MAPGIATRSGSASNGISNDGLSSSYEIDMDAIIGSYQRRVKVITIGAGVSGILMAYKIQKLCSNVEHVIYEKNEDIGGTWLENRYPNCACDVPSHAYIYDFAPNPEWPHFYSYSPDIWKYLDRICNTFDLRKYMTFNTKVTGAFWEADKGEWRVTMTQTAPDGTEKEIEDRCHVLLNGNGLLNSYKWPELEGREKFKGKVIHTARWPQDYQAEQWKNERVAVIGSGASSIQTVPGMQPYVKHLDVFVRTAVWFTSIAGNEGLNKPYPDEDRAKFRNDPAALVAESKFIENQVNGLWGTFYKDSEAQLKSQEFLRKRMAEWIKDERLLKGERLTHKFKAAKEPVSLTSKPGFTPTFGVGCQRVTPGDPYMQAIQEPNVDVHFTAVAKFTENGVLGEDGIEREADTVVCATGFDTSYRPRFPIIGEGGVDLREKWKICPESYLGLAVPGFPNYITFIGPTFPVENGSVMGPLVEVANYAVKMIKKIQNEQIHSLAPRQDVTDAFNDHVQEWVKHTVWVDDCRSWYKNNETGRVNAIWPGSSLHYIDIIKEPRFEDYIISYENKKNMWSFLGMGRAPANVIPGSDYSPYLSVEAIDPLWLEEIQGKRDREQKDAETVTATETQTAVQTDYHTVTATQTEIATVTGTQFQTEIQTVTNTHTDLQTVTNLQTDYQTVTNVETVTDVKTNFETITNIQTVVDLQTVTDIRTNFETVTALQTVTDVQTVTNIQTNVETITAMQTVTDHETVTNVQTQTVTQTAAVNQACATSTGLNIVANPGFEVSGSWVFMPASSDSDVEIAAGGGQEGARYLRMRTPGTSSNLGQNVLQSISVCPGRSYKLTFWYKRATSAGTITVRAYLGSIVVFSGTATSSTWVEGQGVWTAPNGLDSAMLRFEAAFSGGVGSSKEVNLDNVKVVATS